MKKNVFSMLSARAALALAASLLIGLYSCKKEKSGSKPDPVGGGGSVTMTTGIAVGEEITLWFAIGDEPSVEGAEVRESKEEAGWLRNKYTLKAQNLVIKGKVTKLGCFNSSITSLDVSGNTELTALDCKANTLTSLDVSKNTWLTELDCRKNQLTSLDVSKNTWLTELDCSINTLTSLDVSKNTWLTELDCANTSLTSLDVSGNTELTEFSCHDNKLTSLDVSGNTKLTYLSCYNNTLSSLDASGSTKLTHLSCYKNKLTFGELKLPELSANGNLYFKYTDGENSQKLTKDEVKKIREKKWTVWQYNGEKLVEYPGE